MEIFDRLPKLLLISLLTVFLFLTFSITDRANAINITGGFAAGTKIATTNGDVTVENLQVGERVISYNFEIHHRAENTVKKIETKSSLSYYLINNQTKLTGTNLVYIRTLVKPKLVRLQLLKPEDKVFDIQHHSTVISFVEQIVKPINIYQVILDNQQGNLYADNLLIHVGNELPLYFQRQAIDCKPGTPYFKQCPNINSMSGVIAAIVTILCIPLWGASHFGRKIEEVEK